MLKLLQWILRLFYPERCPYCGEILADRLTECETCRSQLPQEPRVVQLPSGHACVAPFAYDGSVRRAILDYKFRGNSFNAESFAAALARAIEQTEWQPDVLTCIPLSQKSQRARGFNQSELAARKTAALLHKPYADLLVKCRNNLVQHELNAEQRRQNVVGVYRASQPQQLVGKKVLLIDDICTTGSTLAEGCRVLQQAGADKIYCAAIAIAEA